MERSVMSKKDLLLIAVILLLALIFSAVFLMGRDPQIGVAALSIDGKIVELFQLAEEEDRIIDLQEQYAVPVKLEIRDHAIRFLESQCPDHICEGYGFISRETETAVCMPNRCVLLIYSPQDNITIES
ncbi:MAG: NusG domain II-containing protein [Oscillospiraceae bacterium]|nr:NusG domain II-containing protein [Oscillospiraceae bacterium]